MGSSTGATWLAMRANPLKTEGYARCRALIPGGTHVWVDTEIQVVRQQTHDASTKRVVADTEGLQRCNELTGWKSPRDHALFEGLAVLADVGE
jgi:hypothetical protein